MALRQVVDVAEIVSAVAVVISLLYLANQIQQNTDTIRLTNAREVMEASRLSFLNLATNEGLADVLRRSDDGEELTRTDLFRIRAFASSGVRLWEGVYYQHEQGMLDDRVFRSYERRIGRNFLINKTARDRWDRMKYSFDPEFQKWIDDHLADHPLVEDPDEMGGGGN